MSCGSRLFHPNPLRNLDVNLRVTRSTNGKAAFSLLGQGILFRQVVANDIGLFKGRINEGKLRIALFEVLSYNRIMRTPQNDVLNLRISGQDVVDLGTDLGVDVVLVEVTSVNPPAADCPCRSPEPPDQADGSAYRSCRSKR